MNNAVDAEGSYDGVACPVCGGTGTITFRYVEGFEELECPDCGYRSDAEELDALTRYESALLESDDREPAPIPRRSIEA